MTALEPVYAQPAGQNSEDGNPPWTKGLENLQLYDISGIWNERQSKEEEESTESFARLYHAEEFFIHAGNLLEDKLPNDVATPIGEDFMARAAAALSADFRMVQYQEVQGTNTLEMATRMAVYADGGDDVIFERRMQHWDIKVLREVDEGCYTDADDLDSKYHAILNGLAAAMGLPELPYAAEGVYLGIKIYALVDEKGMPLNETYVSIIDIAPHGTPPMAPAFVPQTLPLCNTEELSPKAEHAAKGALATAAGAVGCVVINCVDGSVQDAINKGTVYSEGEEAALCSHMASSLTVINTDTEPVEVEESSHVIVNGALIVYQPWRIDDVMPAAAVKPALTSNPMVERRTGSGYPVANTTQLPAAEARDDGMCFDLVPYTSWSLQQLVAKSGMLSAVTHIETAGTELAMESTCDRAAYIMLPRSSNLTPSTAVETLPSLAGHWMTTTLQCPPAGSSQGSDQGMALSSSCAGPQPRLAVQGSVHSDLELWQSRCSVTTPRVLTGPQCSMSVHRRRSVDCLLKAGGNNVLGDLHLDGVLDFMSSSQMESWQARHTPRMPSDPGAAAAKPSVSLLAGYRTCVGAVSTQLTGSTTHSLDTDVLAGTRQLNALGVHVTPTMTSDAAFISTFGATMSSSTPAAATAAPETVDDGSLPAPRTDVLLNAQSAMPLLGAELTMMSDGLGAASSDLILSHAVVTANNNTTGTRTPTMNVSSTHLPGIAYVSSVTGSSLESDLAIDMSHGYVPESDSTIIAGSVDGTSSIIMDLSMVLASGPETNLARLSESRISETGGENNHNNSAAPPVPRSDYQAPADALAGTQQHAEKQSLTRTAWRFFERSITCAYMGAGAVHGIVSGAFACIKPHV